MYHIIETNLNQKSSLKSILKVQSIAQTQTKTGLSVQFDNMNLYEIFEYEDLTPDYTGYSDEECFEKV